jgi:hypothetical protein
MLAVTSPKIVYLSAGFQLALERAYWLDEVTGLSVSLTTGDDGGTFLNTALDIVHDSVVLGLRNLRTLVGGLIEWISAWLAWHLRRRSNVPDSKLGSGGLELLGELVVNALLDVDSGTSTTSLTVVEAGISASNEHILKMSSQDTLTSVCDGIVNVGIVKDDVGTLSTELERDLLQVGLRSLLEDLLSDSGRTGKGDLVDSWGRSKSLTDGRTVTDNDVDDTSGDTGLDKEFRHVHGGKRGQLGRLHDDSTSGSEGGSDLPREHVERLGVRNRTV